MSNTYIRSILICFILIFLLKSVLYAGLKDTVYVSTAEQLISSVKSERVIIITSDQIELPDNEFIIENVYQLEITGNSIKQNKITSSIPHNTIIIFIHSNNIKIQNLSIGHFPEVGYCTGDVLYFKECNNVLIHNCDLFGSGVVGLNISKSNIWCYNTTIRDCSENIINLNTNRSSLSFYNCNFYLNSNNEMEYYCPRFENCNFYDAEKKIIEKDYCGYYPEEALIINAETDTGYKVWQNANETGEFENVCPNTFKISSNSSFKPYSTKRSNSNKNSSRNKGVNESSIGKKIIYTVTNVVADYETWGLNGEFKIINGNSENESEWKAFSRVKQFKLIRNNKLVAFINIQDTPNLQSFYLNEIFGRNNFAIGEVLEFEITEVYMGDKYEETAITYFSACCSP